ncbi:AraC family transcriptional regulator [Acetobacterium paludosum]|uniref:AraC family transcriptional regulator n=1 Tax=Acetobacterium paludosum TaxID=52693 RepID=A0A923HSU7_9FIRM|nr:AraC family transcriptional regulator [Acetobacterium paludosum]
MSNIEVLKQREQPTLTIRTNTKIEDLPQLIGESYRKIGSYLQEIGVLMSDVPFVAYHNLDMQNLDVEIGFPVAMPLPGKGEIQASSIPEGKVVFCMYQGPYSGMESVYGEMAKWITDNGYTPKDTAYECYYNDPTFPESQWLTKILMPVK